MSKTLICAAFAAGLGVAAVYADDAKDQSAKFQGAYTIVSGERDGKALPAETFNGSLMIVTGDKIVGTDKDKKQIFSCTYKLEAGTNPMKIAMKSAPIGEAPKDPDPKTPDSPGLIAMDDQNVRIIYALPGGDAPTEFKTKDKQHMFVLKRVEVKK